MAQTAIQQTTARVKKHRAQLRRSGLRPLQIWVADTRQKGFGEECKRQSAQVRHTAHEKEVLQFFDAAAARDGWTA